MNVNESKNGSHKDDDYRRHNSRDSQRRSERSYRSRSKKRRSHHRRSHRSKRSNRSRSNSHRHGQSYKSERFDRHKEIRSRSSHHHRQSHRAKEMDGYSRHRDRYYSRCTSNSSESSGYNERYLTSRDRHRDTYDRERGSNDRFEVRNNYSEARVHEIRREAAWLDSMLQRPISAYTTMIQKTQNNRCDYPSGRLLAEITNHENADYMSNDFPQYHSHVLPNLSLPLSADHRINPSGVDSELTLRPYEAECQQYKRDMQSPLPFISERPKNETITTSRNAVGLKDDNSMGNVDCTKETGTFDSSEQQSSCDVVPHKLNEIERYAGRFSYSLQRVQDLNKDSVTAGGDTEAYNSRPRNTPTFGNRVIKAKQKEDVLTLTSVIKNDNPNWHSLSMEMTCKLCKFIDRRSLVSHYVNFHPNNEVFPSRVTPDVAELLRDSKAEHKCEKVRTQRGYAYAQFCYFCNMVFAFDKFAWTIHMARHTGYYKFQCSSCSRKFAAQPSHKCVYNCKIEILFRPEFEQVNLMAYLCNLCNYIRFNKIEIEHHLKGEHRGDVKNSFKEVIFLSFPRSENALKTTSESNENQDCSIKPPINYAELPAHKPNFERDKEISIIKNNNPDWNCLNRDKKCKICNRSISFSLVNHYVKDHPNSEVFSSRVAPDVANFLRNPNEIHKYETLMSKDKHRSRKYKQFCYFCNESKCLRKEHWIRHMITHTGYFMWECIGCFEKIANCHLKHVCSGISNLRKVPQPQFHGVNLIAYLCDLCNFVRFNKTEIEKHLICEHEDGDKDKFKEVIFLRFLEGSNNQNFTMNEKKIVEATKVTAIEKATEIELSSTINANDRTYLARPTEEFDAGCESNESDVANIMSKVIAILSR